MAHTCTAHAWQPHCVSCLMIISDLARQLAQLCCFLSSTAILARPCNCNDAS